MRTPSQFTLRHPGSPRRAGFTMTEMLVSMGVLAMILVLTTNMVSGTQKTLRSARASAAQFREARRAFETLTRTLSQTTLNTYWDYDPPAPKVPTAYIRQSELHFVTGPSDKVLNDSSIYGHCVFFNAPFGYAGSDATGKDVGTDPYRDLETLLNAWGYYVTYAEDDNAPGFIEELQAKGQISIKKGFRLMEFRQPSEELSIYKDDLRRATNKAAAYSWFRSDLDKHSRVVAENIIAMVIRPVVSEEDADEKNRDRWWIAPDYLYDSRGKQLNTMTGDAADASQNQLPPVLELTLVAVEEKTFLRYAQGGSAESQIGNVVNGLFDDPEDLQEDIEKLSRELDELDINYRVFQASVGLRTAKWSD